MEKNILGTNIVTQVAILVHDIEKSSKEFADFLGLEPPSYNLTDGIEITKATYNGEPCPAKAKLAFLNVGPNVTIELIEPDENPSVWRDDLDKNGEGVHHIAFNVNGMQQVIKTAERNGFKMLQQGEWIGGRYAYLDTESTLKVKVELLEND